MDLRKARKLYATATYIHPEIDGSVFRRIN